MQHIFDFGSFVLCMHCIHDPLSWEDIIPLALSTHKNTIHQISQYYSNHRNLVLFISAIIGYL